MTLSLRSRLFLTQALVVVIALLVMGAFAAGEQRRWVIARTHEQLARAAERAAAALPAASADWDALANRMGEELGYRVTLIDSSGRVLGDSEVAREDLPRVESHAGRPEVRVAMAAGEGSATRMSRTVNRELLYVAVRVPQPGQVAVLRVAEPLATIAAADAALARLSAVSALVALLASIPLLWWATSRRLMRLRELAATATRFGAGDFTRRATERPGDEIGRLGAAVNRMANDLSERLARLGRERDETEQILARLADGVALLDPDGRIVRVNDGLARLIDAPRPPEGSAFRDAVRSPELDELIEDAVTSRRTLERDVRLWAQRSRLLRATATPLVREDGVALVLVLHDLTEVEAAHRMRQDFVANVSHDLRTPLTSVRGYAETLLDGGLEDVEHREEFVRIIRDQTTRLQALVDDLMTLAELERPGAALRLERFDLREPVEHQAAVARDRARRAGLAFEVDSAPPIEVRADRARIEQVMANLLDNAVKYTERGGVRVSMGVDGRRAWCAVRDTGPGIPSEDLPRIFERFYRVDKARSRELGGTGLGLSIVKHIANLHGGEVSVDSTLGHGSTFRFEIPLEPGDLPPA